MDTPEPDRVDTVTLEKAKAIVLKEMRLWDEDEPAGAYFTDFGDFDPLL